MNRSSTRWRSSRPNRLVCSAESTRLTRPFVSTRVRIAVLRASSAWPRFPPQPTRVQGIPVQDSTATTGTP